MAPVFYTKKQKAQMRERKKRKRKVVEHYVDENEHQHSKMANGVNVEQQQQQKDVDQLIVIPPRLSGKEARKFRKEARRKARAEGKYDCKLLFVSSANQSATPSGGREHEQPPRKKRKTFPCINELLERQKEEKLKQQQEEAIRQEEERFPESVKLQHIAMDCEMVGIGTGGKQSALARVSLVDWYGNTVMDSFVQVPSRVTDFRTFVSGVTPKDISHKKAMEVKECRLKVASLIKDKILVGHALKNDLQALLLTHPKDMIRDTAKYRPFQRASGRSGGKWRPRKLRDLVKEHLQRDIQVKGESHDSVEDAQAAMDLFKRVRVAWEKELEKKSSAMRKRKH